MSIRFRCDRCGQKLRVGDEKSGLQAKCPKCKSLVTVPAPAPGDPEAPSTTADPAAEASQEMKNTEHRPPVDPAPSQSLPAIAIGSERFRNEALPEVVIRDDSVDWDNATDSSTKRSETIIDYDKVAVPRRVLYLQGGLIAVVALLSFVLGMLMRNGSTPSATAGRVPQPCILSGLVTYGDSSRPDTGSVVIVLPADRRPAADGRLAIEGLRPGDPVPMDGNLSLRTIRGLGGDYGRTNDSGMYQIRLPENGRYHILVISHRAARSGDDRLEVADVAQMGRYFASAVDLLADRRYQWRTLALRGDTTLDASF